MTELQGKVALITGAGRGLGAAICRSLADAGANVVPADVRHDLAEQVAAELPRCDGAVCLDVSDERSVEQALCDVRAKHGGVDVLVNNAGVDVTAPLSELPVEQWDRVLAVNLRGPFLVSKHAMEMMRERGSGHIVNIVSTAAKRTWANASAYHASKWGLLGFSHALHVEARPHNIKVTAIISGGMRTPFLLERFPDIDESTLQDPANVAETVRFVLTQPPGTVIPELMVIPMKETSWP